MSNPMRVLALTGVLLFSLSTAPDARAANADPPGRVAHLNQAVGEVSYSPAGEDDWMEVTRNRPLGQGDRLWTDRDARAEVQVGNAALRLGADTSVELLSLDDNVAQIRLTQGTLNLRVPRLYRGQSYEVATPILAFTVTQPGRYRIDVDEQDDQTTVVVWEGAGEAYGDQSHFALAGGDTVRFYGADLRDHEIYDLPRADAFDRYCLERDRRLDRSASLRYVDADVVGYAELDDYGSWRPVRGYGTAWFPSRVDADWAPYRDGHWVWQEPWGWTWVDNAPWGFAPSHYGRWVHADRGWGWVPGPRNVRPVYAPALVAFVGGNGWSVSLSVGQASPIGWFPLAPREAYVPSYAASRDYFTRVNVNNTVINNTTITNVYNNNYGNGNTNVTQVNYANRTVVGAVTAVPSTVFVNAQPVRQAAIRVEGAAATTGQITRNAPVTPIARSVLGQGQGARARPSREAQERRVVAHNAPAPAERPFAAREQQLRQKPGVAPEPAAVQAAPASAAAEQPQQPQNVKVIAEKPGAVDARAAGSTRREERQAARNGKPGQRRPLERPAEAASGPAPAPAEAPAAAQAPAASEPQAAERPQPTAKDQREAARQQRDADRQQRAEGQRKGGKQDQERQQKADSDQQAARAAQAEQQRKAESDQQAARAAQAEQQRKADSEQQGAKAAQVEQQRKADSEQQAAKAAQAEQQRKAESDQQAAKAEQQRRGGKKDQEQREQKAESDQQAAKAAQVEQQRKADSDQQAAKAAQVEQQRKADSDQQAAKAAQVEQQRKADSDQQAAKAERQRKADEEEQAAKTAQAECVRQARDKNLDERQCVRTPAKKRSGKKTADNNSEGAGGGRNDR